MFWYQFIQEAGVARYLHKSIGVGSRDDCKINFYSLYTKLKKPASTYNLLIATTFITIVMELKLK